MDAGINPGDRDWSGGSAKPLPWQKNFGMAPSPHPQAAPQQSPLDKANAAVAKSFGNVWGEVKSETSDALHAARVADLPMSGKEYAEGGESNRPRTDECWTHHRVAARACEGDAEGGQIPTEEVQVPRSLPTFRCLGWHRNRSRGARSDCARCIKGVSHRKPGSGHIMGPNLILESMGEVGALGFPASDQWNKAARRANAEGANIRPVDLDIKNPLRMNDAIWEDPSLLSWSLEKVGAFGPEDTAAVKEVRAARRRPFDKNTQHPANQKGMTG